MSGVFAVPNNVVFFSPGFKLNCHKCGKSFSPLSVYSFTTDRREYYLGTYCRLYVIAFPIEKERDLLCDCLKSHFKYIDMLIDDVPYTFPCVSVFVYDPKDDMEGKILEKSQ